MFVIYPVYADIRSRLLAWGTDRRFAVVEGEVGQGNDIPRLADGSLRPTVVIISGTPESDPRGIHITGERDNLGMYDISFVCLAGDQDSLIRLVDQVRLALLGYQPPYCGEMIEIANRPRQPVESMLSPYRFGQTVGFIMSIDANVAS